MITVWKYPFKGVSRDILQIPCGYEFLTVQLQNEVPTIWVLVFPNNPLVNVIIDCIGTGTELPREDAEYIGTVQFEVLVWHFFGRREESEG